MSELQSPFEPLHNTPLLPSSEMDAVGEDVSGPIDFIEYHPNNLNKYIKVDMSKIQTIEDVKLVLATLQLACTEDMFDTFKISHLKGEVAD
jgi:hypothetical protein